MSDSRTSTELAALYREEMPSVRPEVFRALALCCVAETLRELCALAPTLLQGSRLRTLGNECATELSQQLKQKLQQWAAEGISDQVASRELCAAHRLGECLDLLQAAERSSERKKWGSYFTPPQVAQRLTERAFAASLEQPATSAALRSRGLNICDPAVGGGAFLLEALARVSEWYQSQGDLTASQARERSVMGAFGLDRSALAVAVTESALCLFAGTACYDRMAEQLQVGDALLGDLPGQPQMSRDARKQDWGRLAFDWQRAFSRVFESPSRGFDWLVGNPPWVAFQGRATQKIPVALRAHYRQSYRSFSGYPTLHGMFVERAAALAPSGTVSLLLPSSLADLDGYRPTRLSLTESHQVLGQLPEFGQDAFERVVQPCFGLIALSCQAAGLAAVAPGSELAWALEEKSFFDGEAELVRVPECLLLLGQLPCFAKETFGELGFQSNTQVVRELFFKGDAPQGLFQQPLLEGRRVAEFVCRDSQLFLNADPKRLAELRCRLKSPELYQKVDILVRQTAAYPIAARSNGLAFRNSLIAAYAGNYDVDLLVGLLNSSLLRAIHVARTRDARQATFPQVKVAHLRALPAPPEDQQQRAAIAALSHRASRDGGLNASQRQTLDDLVFRLYGLNESDAEAVRVFLEQRAPKALRASLENTEA